MSSDTQTYIQVWGDFKPPPLGSCGISDEEDCMQVQLILNLCISRIVSISLLFNLFSSMRDLLTAGQPLVINQSKRPIFKNQRPYDHAYAWCPHGRWFLKNQPRRRDQCWHWDHYAFRLFLWSLRLYYRGGLDSCAQGIKRCRIHVGLHDVWVSIITSFLL